MKQQTIYTPLPRDEVKDIFTQPHIVKRDAITENLKLQCYVKEEEKYVLSEEEMKEHRKELLESYSLFLEEHGYIDTDWRDEEQFAIDKFFSLNNL